jgi:hypothetical protein
MLGDKKIIKRFLFLPLEINGERRWFETCNIEQEFVIEINDSHHLLDSKCKDIRHVPRKFMICGELKWKNIRFIDDSVTP